VLPPLTENEILVTTDKPAEGMLFTLPAVGLAEQRSERKRTIEERCELSASKVICTGEPALVWCHLNVEGDRLERLIPGSVQVSGKDSDEAKEEAFTGFSKGDIRVIVTKPTIGAWGLNFQHCNHMTTFPSHSFEQYYQSVRRCWRFGQKSPVTVDVITSEGERGVVDNLHRKSDMADKLFANLVREMYSGMNVVETRDMAKKTNVPSWL
jgi:hypothetical protein